jgi:FkbM family methyltransferase
MKTHSARLKDALRLWLPRQIKARTIWAGPLRGARLVTSWHDYPGALLGRTERPLLTWFDQHVSAGMTWLDVGAHYGYTALALSRLVGPSGRVVAFEPMLETAAHLSETRRRNRAWNMTVVPLGLGPDHDLVTLLAASERGMATLVGRLAAEPVPVILVGYEQVDSALNIGRVDGVKIDVQGMELGVLRGMADMLRRDHPELVVEIHAGVDREGLVSLLRSLGYRAPGIAIDGLVSGPPYADDTSYHFTTNEPPASVPA